jgi:4a-hydroxytetrahydrobiopterin dehydratase
MELEQARRFLAEIPGWEIIIEENIPRLQRSFKFKNFVEALTFTNKVGEIAEAERHHPMLITEWGKVTVVWWTHAIRGLHQNDFIMASKTNDLYEARQG